MNKKSTLLAAAFMAVSSLTVSAADVVPGAEAGPENYAAGNYYYLKSGDNYLSLSGNRADSVIVKGLNFNESNKDYANKAARDSALWEITKVGTETGGAPIYQFKNKKTKSILSFQKSEEAESVLAEGVSRWSFTDNKIVAYWDNNKSLALTINDKNELVLGATTSTKFSVVAPGEYMMSAKDLGDSFSVFRLSFGGEFDGDIFSGKDLIATDSKTDKDFVTLKIKGDEFFPDEKDKFLGVDTTKTFISNAQTVYGAKFTADSTYKDPTMHTALNGDYQLFRFRADLKNDSLIMLVKRAPQVNNDKLTSSTDFARVVYAQVGDNKVLTVADRKGGDGDDRNDPKNGIAPFITVEKGTPSKIEGGTGVYFLKSASKGENGGKYISAYKNNTIEPMTGTPSVNQLEGQWYIKEEGGLYSIVDRNTDSHMLMKGEIFAVQGMPNTFTFGGNADSITVEAQKVNLDDKFLGSVNFTKEQLANNGYVLNLVPAGAETSNSYAFTSDSILQVKTGDAKDAVVFKVVAVDTVEIGGAQSLKDTVSIVTYQLKSQFSDKYVAYDNTAKSLKVSDPKLSKDAAVNFYFKTNEAGTQYNMQIADENDNKGKFITADSYSSNMIFSETPAYFNFVEMDAPEYMSFESHHKRYTSELKSLTMNPLNFFAEAKQEGQDILKSGYEKDNFSLWTIKSEASTAEKPLYFITTSLPNVNPEADRIRYYMVSGRDSSLVDASGNPRVNFIANDTIETMKDSKNNPALFAMRVTESGNYLLENQKEVTLGTKGAPYVAIINNVVVMSKNGAEFAVESVAGPVANEAIDAPNTIKVIGGNGDLNILNASGKKVTLSNVLGQAIATRVLSSDNETIAAARGIIIVSVEGERAYKVIVK